MRIRCLKIAVTAIAMLVCFVSVQAGEQADVSAFISMGEQQWEAGKLDDAQKTFEQAAVVAPRSLDALFKLGAFN